MRCISPLTIYDKAGHRQIVPCGKCNFCLQTKRADWSFRLAQEDKHSLTSTFLTFTYENDSIPRSDNGCAVLDKRDLQLFIKRLRKANKQLVDWRLRYYAVGEYGTVSHRPHYHALMFNLHPSLISDIVSHWRVERNGSLIPGGMCYAGNVEAASIHYVAKYVINRVADYGLRAPPFALMSRRPGIGANYLDTHSSWHRADMRNYTQVHGQVGRLPRYYKDKIFTSLDRAKLAREAVAVGDIAYWDTVAKISKFHDDPYHYYDESVLCAHDKITSKINQLNTL